MENCMEMEDPEEMKEGRNQRRINEGEIGMEWNPEGKDGNGTRNGGMEEWKPGIWGAMTHDKIDYVGKNSSVFRQQYFHIKTHQFQRWKYSKFKFSKVYTN